MAADYAHRFRFAPKFLDLSEDDLAPPLDKAVKKLWGYASERARHIREGQAVETEEAELVVSVACAVCTFLSRQTRT